MVHRHAITRRLTGCVRWPTFPRVGLLLLTGAAEALGGGADAAVLPVPRVWLSIAVLMLLAAVGVGILAVRAWLSWTTSEKSLSKSERQFRQIAETMNDVCWVMAPDFSRMDYVNPAYETVWGRSCESLRQDPMSWSECLFPHDRQAVLAWLDTGKGTTADGGSAPDFRIVDAGGHVRWIQMRTFAIRSGDTPECRVVGLCRDITNGKFAEASLRESEQKWRALMENSPDHILLIDLDGHILFANRRFLGVDPPHLIGRPLVDLMDPDVQPNLLACLERVMQHGQGSACRVVHTDRTRRKRVFELRMRPVTVNDQPVAVAVNATEITRRVAQEHALRESDAFHRTLFDEAPIGLAIQDFSDVGAAVDDLKAAGVDDLPAYLSAHPDEVSRLARLVKWVKVNPALLELYRTSDGTGLPGPLDRRLKAGDWQHFVDQVVAFTGGRDRYEGEARNVDVRGRTLHLIIRKAVIQRGENGLSKILTSLIDVTPLKAAEKERELLMLQLQQAQKMEAIGTLAGGVAHDFNNILSIVLGNAELAVADLPSPSPVRENLQEIKRASLRAKEIVRQLLGISRKSDQALSPMPLIPVVEEALNFLRATLPANIEIQSSFSVANDVVRAEATQIHQILINLFTNAGHAMEENGGRLSVRAENVVLEAELPGAVHTLPPGGYLRLTVADTGTGIPDGIRGRIFDPYFTTKPLGKGTGMGLSMVLGIMKSSGGGIVLDTRPGQGTRFDLYFPLVDEAPHAAAVAEEKPVCGSERILFVDDEAMIVKLTGKILDRLGYRVKTCMDPRQALSLIEAAPEAFDLVIADLSMPDMTGDRLVEAIRRFLPGIPVILCTGNAERLSPGKIEALGIGDVLEKPVAVSRLATAIRRVLNHARSADP